MEQTVAVLGTGTMGAGMAGCIADAGFATRVWNRTRERAEPLAQRGARVCDTAAEAVEGADVVVTMLFDAASVEKVLRQAAPGLAAGAVLLQTSTVGAAGADRLAGVAAELGLVYLDCPVLGTRQPAEQGALTVLASGPDDVRARCTPVLDAVGARTIWVGPAGAGSRLKLAVNAWVLTVVEGVAESLALARSLGIDPQLFLDTVRGGGLDAPYVQAKGAAMLAGDVALSFGLDGAVKDAMLVEEAAASVGLDLALMPGVRRHFERALAEGGAHRDMAATYAHHG